MEYCGVELAPAVMLGVVLSTTRNVATVVAVELLQPALSVTLKVTVVERSPPEQAPSGMLETSAHV